MSAFLNDLLQSLVGKGFNEQEIYLYENGYLRGQCMKCGNGFVQHKPFSDGSYGFCKWKHKNRLNAGTILVGQKKNYSIVLRDLASGRLGEPKCQVGPRLFQRIQDCMVSLIEKLKINTFELFLLNLTAEYDLVLLSPTSDSGRALFLFEVVARRKGETVLQLTPLRFHTTCYVYEAATTAEFSHIETQLKKLQSTRFFSIKTKTSTGHSIKGIIDLIQPIMEQMAGKVQLRGYVEPLLLKQQANILFEYGVTLRDLLVDPSIKIENEVANITTPSKSQTAQSPSDLDRFLLFSPFNAVLASPLSTMSHVEVSDNNYPLRNAGRRRERSDDEVPTGKRLRMETTITTTTTTNQASSVKSHGILRRILAEQPKSGLNGNFMEKAIQRWRKRSCNEIFSSGESPSGMICIRDGSRNSSHVHTVRYKSGFERRDGRHCPSPTKRYWIILL